MGVFDFGEVGVSTMDKAGWRETVGKLLRNSDARTIVVKINTEILLRARRESEFASVLNLSNLNLADGKGVLWAARYLTLPISQNHFLKPIQAIWQMIYSGSAIIFNPSFIKYPIPESIPGVEALELMLESAEQADAGVFFFGAPQNHLEQAVGRLQQKFPKLKVSGYLNGYDFQKDQSIDPLKIINDTDAKLLIVALGSPRQEYWIKENLSKFKNVRVAVGEGGTLDRLANPGQLAPKWLNRIGLEWLWRLFFNESRTETRNRFQRFWNSVPVFIFDMVKLKIYNNYSG